MGRVRLLPWEYGVRNLTRRPVRTALTLSALTIVVLLVFVVVSFIRGLESSLASSGHPQVVLVYSINAEENIENSTIAAQVPGLLTASLKGIRKQFDVPCVSPEMFLGTRVSTDNARTGMGLVRGVTSQAPQVRGQVQISEGGWPQAGEIMVGTLTAAKLGFDPETLKVGEYLTIEKQRWRIAGRFSAGGTALESEIWCRLEDFQQALKRQDLSLVAVMLDANVSPAEIDLFCKGRTDLELQAIGEVAYYDSLQRHYGPVRALAWLVVVLVASSGVFAGMNMMYGAVAGRVRELAALQAIGYRRIAIALSLFQESTLLATAASLIASAVALVFLNGMAVRFTMGAFTLRLDSFGLLIGMLTGLSLGICGAIPPALKALHAPVAQSLKAL
ncbi:MAG: ABC transporter permease [Planctomycetia bacterium]|nr:ABC transporter permease [Planctomycetia bacterium]